MRLSLPVASVGLLLLVIGGSIGCSDDKKSGGQMGLPGMPELPKAIGEGVGLGGQPAQPPVGASLDGTGAGKISDAELEAALKAKTNGLGGTSGGTGMSAELEAALKAQGGKMSPEVQAELKKAQADMDKALKDLEALQKDMDRRKREREQRNR